MQPLGQEGASLFRVAARQRDTGEVVQQEGGATSLAVGAPHLERLVRQALGFVELLARQRHERLTMPAVRAAAVQFELFVERRRAFGQAHGLIELTTLPSGHALVVDREGRSEGVGDPLGQPLAFDVVARGFVEAPLVQGDVAETQVCVRFGLDVAHGASELDALTQQWFRLGVLGSVLRQDAERPERSCDRGLVAFLSGEREASLQERFGATQVALSPGQRSLGQQRSGPDRGRRGWGVRQSHRFAEALTPVGERAHPLPERPQCGGEPHRLLGHPALHERGDGLVEVPGIEPDALEPQLLTGGPQPFGRDRRHSQEVARMALAQCACLRVLVEHLERELA